MRLTTFLAVLALLLGACAMVPPQPAAVGDRPPVAPRSEGPAGGGAGPALPAGAAQPGTSTASAPGGPASPAKPAQVPPRVRVKGYTPGQPTLIFFDADG